MIEFKGQCQDVRVEGNSRRNTNQFIIASCCGATIKPHDKDDHVSPLHEQHPWDKPYLDEKYQFLGIAFFAQPPEYPLEQKGAEVVQITLDNGEILTVWEQKECICNGN